MSALDVRSHFLSDHAQLRGKASVLRSLALSVMRGDTELASALRLKGLDLQDHLHRHMTWEENALLPILDNSGSARSAASLALISEHHEQRERLSNSLRSLEAFESHPKELAQVIMDLISCLESDMASEEASVLVALDALSAQR